MNLIKAEYNGIEYELIIVDWIELLKDKPIAKHLNKGAIWKRFKQQKITGYTNRQCLGIDEIEPKYDRKKPSVPLDHPREMPLIRLRASFLSKALTVQEGICQN